MSFKLPLPSDVLASRPISFHYSFQTSTDKADLLHAEDPLYEECSKNHSSTRDINSESNG